MEQELLQKVRLTQLEIAKEIRRVCEENGISYFLAHGTFLGAVRHGLGQSAAAHIAGKDRAGKHGRVCPQGRV